ncbi:hypothetical protein KFL_004410020 [Klebsormidium nitens]|uniref:Uncharacterized protein n=1 Tax=Klebsormidium nitens TaxID=105231 RepID=A0A1Y1IC82_KLENI|nr:hypothetical protein KFL_004410020 [Klebsormidium nitens]|eukprot:GAQ88574.1 hypothetical protein KFL_004410020 [Klebsormidium nitens]
MATTLEPPRTKQRLEEPPGVSGREASRAGGLEAGPGKEPVADGQRQFTCSWHVDFPTEEAAVIVCKTLSVDAELNPTKVFREIRVAGKQLLVSFAASDDRLLRTAVNGFKDMQKLAIRTLEEFGPHLMEPAT